MAKISKDTIDARKRLIRAEGDLAYILSRFGDTLSENNGWSENGIEAVWLYLIRTHHWTPAVVRAMTSEDMRFVLSVEMNGFSVKDSD